MILSSGNLFPVGIDVIEASLNASMIGTEWTSSDWWAVHSLMAGLMLTWIEIWSGCSIMAAEMIPTNTNIFCQRCCFIASVLTDCNSSGLSELHHFDMTEQYIHVHILHRIFAVCENRDNEGTVETEYAAICWYRFYWYDQTGHGTFQHSLTSESQVDDTLQNIFLVYTVAISNHVAARDSYISWWTVGTRT